MPNMKVSEFSAYSKSQREIVRQADILWWAIKKFYKPYGELSEVRLYLDDGDFSVAITCEDEPDED